MTKELPTGWEFAKLENVVDILDSKRIPVNAKDRSQRPGKVPYYGATGQVGWIDDYLFDEELILLGEDGAPFLDSSKQKAYLIRGKSWVNNHAHVLRTRNGIPNAYIKYYLDIVDYHEFVAGTTRLKLNQAAMREIPIPIAPPEQQKSIVAEIEKQFSRLDEAVANLKRIKANLKRYKAAVLKAAVEGKLTEEWRHKNPDVEPASKLLERILTERRANWKGKGKYKEPTLPDHQYFPSLPLAWTWGTVDQVAKVQLGKMLDKQKHQSGNRLPYLRNINVRWGRIETEDLLEMFFEEDQLDRFGLEPSDVLVCEGGEPGRASVWNGRIPGLKYQKALHRVRFYGDTEPHYLVILLEFLANTGRLERWFTGSTIKHFTRESFISVSMPIPPLAEQKHIVAEVDRRLSVIEELESAVEANLKRADCLRQSILKFLFSAKLLHTIH